MSSTHNIVECCVCCNEFPLNSLYVLHCSHKYDLECYHNIIQSSDDAPKCPYCRSQFTNNDTLRISEYISLFENNPALFNATTSLLDLLFSIDLPKVPVFEDPSGLLRELPFFEEPDTPEQQLDVLNSLHYSPEYQYLGAYTSIWNHLFNVEPHFIITHEIEDDLDRMSLLRHGQHNFESNQDHNQDHNQDPINNGNQFVYQFKYSRYKLIRDTLPDGRRISYKVHFMISSSTISNSIINAYTNIFEFLPRKYTKYINFTTFTNYVNSFPYEENSNHSSFCNLFVYDESTNRLTAKSTQMQLLNTIRSNVCYVHLKKGHMEQRNNMYFTIRTTAVPENQRTRVVERNDITLQYMNTARPTLESVHRSYILEQQ